MSEQPMPPGEDGGPPSPPRGTLSPDGAWRWEGSRWVAATPDVKPDPTAPTAPPKGDGDTRTQPSRDPDTKRSWVPWAVVAGLLVVIVAATASLLVRGNRADAPAAPTVTGTLTLKGGGGYTEDDPCYGTANSLIDNSDMTPEAPVRILSASGKILGTSRLGPGDEVPDDNHEATCVFTIKVPLDARSTHYQLVIADRPPFDFDDPHGLDLSLGGRN